MLLTIIVPIYNEENGLYELYKRLITVLDTIDMTGEILFVNDGSRDNSLQIIKALSDKDNRISYINLSRNFGKEAAMSAGIDNADGDAVVVIDADLQDPPELIPEMIRLWQQGHDVVYGQRSERHGESYLKKITAKCFYWLVSKVSRVSIPKDTGDFRLMSSRAVRALRCLPENNRFMKGLFAWIGYPQIALSYSRDPRYAGETKFNYWKLWNFALDGITSFTMLPLKLASYIGLFIALCSFIFGAYILLKTLLYGDPVRGYPSLMTVVSFLGGVNLLFLGIAGEYIGRMFEETKKRPVYLLEKFHRSRSHNSFEHNNNLV
jgi:glycosyltransferase involved in cell wall biosynthesis